MSLRDYFRKRRGPSAPPPVEQREVADPVPEALAQTLLAAAHQIAKKYHLGLDEPNAVWLVWLISEVPGREPYYRVDTDVWGMAGLQIEFSTDDHSLLYLQDRTGELTGYGPREAAKAVALVRAAAEQKGLAWEGEDRVELFSAVPGRPSLWAVQSNYGSPFNRHVYGEVSRVDGSLLCLEERERWAPPRLGPIEGELLRWPKRAPKPEG